MIEQIEKSIKKLAKVVGKKEANGSRINADGALKYTQAVQNLANARASIICNPISYNRLPRGEDE